MTGTLGARRLTGLLVIAAIFQVCPGSGVTARTSDGADSTATIRHHTTNVQPTAARVSSLAIEHVSVIIGNGSPVVQDATLVVRNGYIEQIVPSVGFTTPREARRLDATGKFAIPGLWDMHVHLFNNVLQDGSDNHAYFFPRMVANGIVGVRDMWTDSHDIAVARHWNEDSASGKLIGPRVLVASRVVDGDPPNGPHSLVVHDALEGRQAVRTLKACGDATDV